MFKSQPTSPPPGLRRAQRSPAVSPQDLPCFSSPSPPTPWNRGKSWGFEGSLTPLVSPVQPGNLWTKMINLRVPVSQLQLLYSTIRMLPKFCPRNTSVDVVILFVDCVSNSNLLSTALLAAFQLVLRFFQPPSSLIQLSALIRRSWIIKILW